jgi:thiol-disulfide isomerase/thioredoxin
MTNFRLMAAGAVSLIITIGAIVRADDAKPGTPAEQYQQLVKEHSEVHKDYQKAYQVAKTQEERQKLMTEYAPRLAAQSYSPRFLDIVVRYPKDAAAVDAFRWVLMSDPYAQRIGDGVAALGREQIDSERMADVCKTLSYRHCPAGDTLLRAMIAKSQHKQVQGEARFCLAMSLRASSDRLTDRDREARSKYEKEAEHLLQEVLTKYADVEHHPATLGKLADAELFELRHLGIGKVAPDLEGVDLDGRPMKLSDFRGKVVLLDFWGSWCGFCLADVPHQLELLKLHEGKPFAIVGVDSDNDIQAAQKAVKDNRMPWRSFRDGDSQSGPMVKRWNVKSWPTLYLIDEEGVIRYKGDILRTHGVRNNKEGKAVPFNYLDDYVELLLKGFKSARRPTAHSVGGG